jgi:hypothetical protein
MSALAIIAALSVFASSARAVIVGTTTNYSTMTVSLVVATNKPYTLNSHTETYTYTVGKATIDDKVLLIAFANWNGTSWPAGAKLIFDWETVQVCVADKTGTNILFYAGTGISSGTVTAYFHLNWFTNSSGAYTETYVDKDPGGYSYTEGDTGYFEIYYDDTSVPSLYTDISGYGLNEAYYKQDWNIDGDYTGWSESESFDVSGGGGNLFSPVGEVNASFSGSIKESGHGPNYNTYLY